jgi:hypothetical protein
LRAVSLFRLYSAHQARDERYEEEHDENEEENLCDRSGGTGDTTESKNTGDQGYNEEYQSVVKHCDLLCVCWQDNGDALFWFPNASTLGRKIDDIDLGWPYHGRRKDRLAGPRMIAPTADRFLSRTGNCL